MAAFASNADVQTRLGRTLTDPEKATVDAALDNVAGMIRSEANKAPDWTPGTVPGYLKELSIQKAIAALSNPSNVASQSETLGAFSHSETYQRSQDGGITLSDDEGRQVRFAVYGTTSASARVRSHVDTALDLIDDGEINDSLGS